MQDDDCTRSMTVEEWQQAARDDFKLLCVYRDRVYYTLDIRCSASQEQLTPNAAKSKWPERQ